MKLGDKEMALDTLSSAKQLIQSYTTAEMDSANQELRQVFRNLCQDIGNLHASLSNVMSSRGWSKTAVAGQQAIESEIISWEQKQVKEPQLTK